MSIGILKFDKKTKIHKGQKSKAVSMCVHNDRLEEKAAPNADHDRSIFNHDLIDISDYQEKYHENAYYELLKDKVSALEGYQGKYKNGKEKSPRTGSVYGFEITLNYERTKNADREPQPCPLDFDIKERDRWEQLSLKWAQEMFKDPLTGKDNVVAAKVHYDEGNPHMHLLIMPAYDGKLNQHYILAYDKLPELYYGYNKFMAQKFGLELLPDQTPKRNRPKVKATEKDLAIFHSALHVAINNHDFPRLEKDETIEHYEHRVKEAMMQLNGAVFSKDTENQQLRDKMQDIIRNPDLYQQIEIDNARNKAQYAERQNQRLLKENESYALMGQKISDIVQNEPDAEKAVIEVMKSLMDNSYFMEWLRLQQKEKEEMEKEKQRIYKDKGKAGKENIRS